MAKFFALGAALFDNTQTVSKLRQHTSHITYILDTVCTYKWFFFLAYHTWTQEGSSVAQVETRQTQE